MTRTLRRPIPLAIVAVLIVLITAVAVAAFRPSIPTSAATTPLTRAVATSDAGPGSCLDRLHRGEGWLDLCWAVSRLDRDEDASTDYYVLRLYGSHEGLRWLLVRSVLVGSPAGNVYDVWPDGTYGGACRQEAVTMTIPMGPLTNDYLCGATSAHLELPYGQRLEWTCEGCLAADPDTRGVSMYAVVAVDPGTLPAWDVFAEGGG